MANPTLSNGQITDAVSQAGVTVLAHAPAQALTAGYQVAAQAAGLTMQNAIANQRHTATLSGSAATQAAAQILSLAPSHTARSTAETLGGNALASELVSLSAAIHRLQRNKTAAANAHKIGASPADAALPSALAAKITAAGEPGAGDVEGTAASMRPAVDVLVAGLHHLADAITALAASLPGGKPMSDQATLEAIEKAVDRLIKALGEIKERLPQPDKFGAQNVGSPGGGGNIDAQKPVGATLPGILIVGAGNSTTAPTAASKPYIVGASP